MNGVHSAELSGVVKLTPSEQSFVLPVFTARPDNSYFVQVLQGAHELIGFRRLDGDAQVKSVEVACTVMLGEEPIWAFQIDKETTVVERAADFREALELKLSACSISLKPYARWEVERLFGTAVARRAAIQEVHTLLTSKDRRWADYWLTNHLMLPSIREELLRPGISKLTPDQVRELLVGLALSATRDGILLRASQPLLKWLYENQETVQRAVSKAATDWAQLSVNSKLLIYPSPSTGELGNAAGAKQPSRRKRSVVDVERHFDVERIDSAVRSSTVQFCLHFPSSWDARDRRLMNELGLTLANTVAKHERLPGGSLESMHFLCGLQANTTEALIEAYKSTATAGRRRTFIAVYRDIEEAQKSIRDLEGDRVNIDHVWIAEPRPPRNAARRMLDFGVFTSPPKFLGYLRSSHGVVSAARDKGREAYRLIIADAGGLPQAVEAIGLASRASVKGLSEEVETVLCALGPENGLSSESKIAMRSLGVRIVETFNLTDELVRGAELIICFLPAFQLGIVTASKAPLVLADSLRRIGKTFELRHNEEALQRASETLGASFMERVTTGGAGTPLAPGLERAVKEAKEWVGSKYAASRGNYCRASATAVKWLLRNRP